MGEEILSFLIQQATPEEALWHYDDMRENIIDQKVNDGLDLYYPDGIQHNAIPPLNFDPNRKFLHSDKFEYTTKYFEECNVPTDLIIKSQNKVRNKNDYLDSWLNG